MMKWGQWRRAFWQNLRVRRQKDGRKERARRAPVRAERVRGPRRDSHPPLHGCKGQERVKEREEKEAEREAERQEREEESGRRA